MGIYSRGLAYSLTWGSEHDTLENDSMVALLLFKFQGEHGEGESINRFLDQYTQLELIVIRCKRPSGAVNKQRRPFFYFHISQTVW